jgi:hypothetical protein
MLQYNLKTHTALNQKGIAQVDQACKLTQIRKEQHRTMPGIHIRAVELSLLFTDWFKYNNMVSRITSSHKAALYRHLTRNIFGFPPLGYP